MIRLSVTMTCLALVLAWGAPVAAPAQAAPRELGSLATEVCAYGIDVAEDGRLYVAATDAGLWVLAEPEPDRRLCLPWLSGRG